MPNVTEDHGDRIVEVLGNIQLFSALSGEELHELIGKIDIRHFTKGNIILGEEDTSQYMYVILGGKVKVVRITTDGKEVLLALHRAGEFFGELSLIDNQTSPAMVLAAEKSVVAIISRKDFYSLISTQGKVLDTLLRSLCSRLRDSWARIQLLSFNNASQRIRSLLVQLANEYGRKTQDGTLLDIRLTHQDIADMTGVARETATRVIDKLHRDGAIKVIRSKFILLDQDLLEKDYMA